jgi:hypothetical protein
MSIIESLERLEKLIYLYYEEQREIIYQRYKIQEEIYNHFTNNNYGYPCGLRKRKVIYKEID